MGIFSRKKKEELATGSGIGESGTAPLAEEPAQAGSRQGDNPLVTNGLVQEALVGWVAGKNAQSMFGVLRQCATGSLLLDGTDSTIADSTKPFQEGDTLAIGSQVDNAGKRLLLAFTDNPRLLQHRQRGGSTKPPVSFAQPASATLQMAATTYDGIAIDPGSPETSFIAYAAEIRQGLTDDAALNETLKTAITDGEPSSRLIELAEAAPVIFVGISSQTNEQGEVVGMTVPNVRGPEGAAYSPAFTTPAEVWSWGPDLEARPTGFANIARAALEDGHAGVVLNPAGTSAVIPISDLQGRS